MIIRTRRFTLMKKLSLTLGAAYMLASAGAVFACDGHKGADKSTDATQKHAKKQKADSQQQDPQPPQTQPTKS
jgi:hypothetical protein